MNGTLPEKNYYTDSYDAKWSWPSHKFQLKPDALFTTLHERFNTRNCPIQDPYAFLLDVRLCANESNNVDDFYARLAAQKAKRVLELEEIWDNVTDLMAFDEKGLPSDRIWTCKQCNNSGISDVITPCEPMSTNDTPELHSKSFFNMIQTMSFDIPTRDVANDPPPLSQPPSTPSSDPETSFDQSPYTPATTPSPRRAQSDSRTGKRNICTASNSTTAKTANSPHTTTKHTKRGRAASEQSCEDEIIATGEASLRQPRKKRRRVSLQTESDIPAGNAQIQTSAAGTSEATCGVLREADCLRQQRWTPHGSYMGSWAMMAPPIWTRRMHRQGRRQAQSCGISKEAPSRTLYNSHCH
ncbi:hypothetical protein OOU_Y34scaffold00870g2 [Pyricularia oryzae Y34]|uniref:Uncharacterized protein n=1 Tax=Pyricularia oryzae (strain Y34) TaxID=1143189 RepID=A0AA97NPB4_PYRO3|nr:hypothetical protein OOU_Y34scaffold00870g2 [Pyricularia oryzae Y34]